MTRRWIALLALLCTAVLVRVGLAQWKTAWSYDGPRGPEHWSTLDPDYAACAGTAQSPIDIRQTQKASLPPLRVEFESEPLKYLINNGKTVRVNYHDTPGTGSVVVVGGTRYQLTQFHFHRPAEDLVQGQAFDMVAHFMLEASDKHVAGVAVLLKAGRPNPTVATLWAHMPLTEGPEHEIPGVSVNPSDLVPSDTAYYTYEGSVTAPPCTEGVTWFVLKTPVEVSADQIAAFAKLYPHDVRPPQPLNGRIVKESQ